MLLLAEDFPQSFHWPSAHGHKVIHPIMRQMEPSSAFSHLCFYEKLTNGCSFEGLVKEMGSETRTMLGVRRSQPTQAGWQAALQGPGIVQMLLSSSYHYHQPPSSAGPTEKKLPSTELLPAPARRQSGGRPTR